jgi:AcrR family transcriptional regulator
MIGIGPASPGAGKGVAMDDISRADRKMVKPRNYTKGEATRTELMAAAARVFGKNGYVNADVREISLESGKSSGTFYIYFKNKSEILAALIAQFDADLLAGMGLSASDGHVDLPDPALWKQRIRSIWDVYRQHSAIFFAMAQAAALSPEFYAAERRLRQRAIDDFQQLIKVQQAKGLCQDLDPAVAAVAMEAMLRGFLYECLAEPGHKQHSEAELAHFAETLISVIDLILHAG